MDEKIIEIVWTKKASDTFYCIINYLKEEWTEKEVQNFIRETNSLILKLSQHPEIGRPSQKRKNTRIYILNKHTTLTYHFGSRKNKITILLFWNQKRNPKDFIY